MFSGEALSIKDFPSFSSHPWLFSTGAQPCRSKALAICRPGHVWKGDLEKKLGSHLSSITYLLPGASAFSLYTPEQEVFDGLDFLGRLGASLLQGLPELTPLHLPLKELSKRPVSVLFSTFSGSMSPHFSLPLQV